MNKKKITFTLLLLIHCFMVYPQKWIAIDDSKTVGNPIVEIMSSSTKELLLKVTVKGFFRDDVVYNNVKYDNVYFPDEQSLNSVGFPALPVINELIALPKNSTFEISVIDSTWVVLDNYLILPYQKPLLENEKSQRFDVNSVFYASNKSFPTEIYRHSEIMSWRGVENFNLTISPIKHIPKSKQIWVLKDFTIKIEFKQTKSRLEIEQKDKDIDAKHNRALKQSMLNWEEELLKNYYPNSEVESTNEEKETSIRGATNDYKYLIISSPAYVNSLPLMNFKGWKSRIGLKCKIVSTSTTGTTPTSIKNYIFTEYSNFGIEYVLFVGDHSDIPLYTWIDAPSDYWYGCIDPFDDTDYQAEVAIGRFSISNLSELENMVNKSINYEKNPPIDDWVEKSLLIAHKELAPEKYQDCKEEIRTHSYSVTSPNFIKVYGSNPSEGGNSATNQTIINSINNGIGLINYRGHGSTTGWDGAWSYENKAFNASEVAKLTNTTKTPVILSIACNNGEVNSSSICLLESFTRGLNGSVAFLGATIPTYTTVNHYFDKELYKQIYNLATYTIGDLLIQANIQTMLYYSNSTTSKSNVRSYLWGGDPSLELWTQTPAQFTNASISIDGTSVTVNANVPGCTIVVSSIDDGQSYFKMAKNVSSYTFKKVNASSNITITKHNYVPYLGNYTCTTSTVNLIGTVTTPITITSNTTIVSCGDINVQYVKVQNGAKLILDAAGEVNIISDFDVDLGSEFEIKY